MVLLALKVAYHPGLHEVKKLPGTLFFLSVGVPLCLVEDSLWWSRVGPVSYFIVVAGVEILCYSFTQNVARSCRFPTALFFSCLAFQCSGVGGPSRVHVYVCDT